MQRRSFVTNSLRALFFPVLLKAEATEDPWPSTDLLKPEQLARMLSSDSSKLKVIYVGFPVLYRAAHISGANLAGPCSKPEALNQLRNTVAPLQRGSELVIYCGCCPFDKCPNIRPAYRALHDMGFTRLRVLYLATNLHTDWVAKGYPTEKSAA